MVFYLGPVDGKNEAYVVDSEGELMKARSIRGEYLRRDGRKTFIEPCGLQLPGAREVSEFVLQFIMKIPYLRLTFRRLGFRPREGRCYAAKTSTPPPGVMDTPMDAEGA